MRQRRERDRETQRARLGNEHFTFRAAARFQKQELQSTDRELALTGEKALKGISNNHVDKGQHYVNV